MSLEDGLAEVRVSGDGAAEDDLDDIVNPWDVAAKSEKGIDYDKLIRKE